MSHFYNFREIGLTTLISGYDLKLIFPTKRANLQWLLGTFYQDGEELESNTLVGALYF